MSDNVYVARFKCVSGWWLVVEGDPTDTTPMNFLGVQKLHKNFRQVGEQYVSGFSADEIVELRIRPNLFTDWRDEPRRQYVEVSP